LPVVREEIQEALVRYELYSEKVKNTPIALAAATIASNRAINKTRTKEEICTKSAQLLNLLPQLESGIRVEAIDREAQQLAVDSARFVFGDAAPAAALTIASTLFQARDLLLAEQKKDRSMASYLNTMPPANLGELEARVAGQHSELQASNEIWLAKKAEKLKGKCDAFVKSAEGFKSSLTKLIAKRDEMWSQRRGWTAATTANVKTRWNTAWAAFRGNMLLVRDGRDEAPKRKSVEARLQDLAAASAAIVTAKNKLEAKAKELCVESASLASVLRLHANEWAAVEEAMKNAEYKSNSYHVDADAPFVEDDFPEDPAPVDNNDEASAINYAAVGNDSGAVLMAAASAVPATALKSKRPKKKTSVNKEGADQFALDSPPRAQQIARAAGGGAYVPPAWLILNTP
jgi:hypothetical protein